jgi:hypothetical protein
MALQIDANAALSPLRERVSRQNWGRHPAVVATAWPQMALPVKVSRRCGAV